MTGEEETGLGGQVDWESGTANRWQTAVNGGE